MKVYIAAAFINRHIAREISRHFRRSGFKITSRWLNYEDPESETLANMCLEDICAADLLVLYNWNQHPSITGGCHVEFGYALALNKEIILIGDKSNVFHQLKQVRHFEVVTEAIDHLLDYELPTKSEAK